jgi:hypothetical protein
MKVILDSKLYNQIWFEISEKFNYPNIASEFVATKKYMYYKIPVWNDEQELIVNDIFKVHSNNDLYALDWQHDCFIYNPNENISVDTSWFDEKRDVNVYFLNYRGF